MLDRQNIFDFTAEKLLAQGEPARDDRPGDGPRCRYRLNQVDRTLKCAFGWHIPDEVYEPGMDETGRASTVIAEYGNVLPHPFCDLNENDDVEDLMFLNVLQIAHDGGPWSGANIAGEQNYPRIRGRRKPSNAPWLVRWLLDMRLIAAHYGLSDAVLDRAPA